MEKEHAKQKIQELVDKYENVKKSGNLKSYSEQETKNGFIEPLFKILGWNTEDKNEVSLEENVVGAGRPDYSFKINDRVQFYLEAKKFSVDIHDPKWANQSISYSWNKGVTYAILTDFENLKVFNAEAIDKDLSDKLVFDIPYNKLIERFDRLYLLSREAFSLNLLDKYAEEYGKKLQKVSVSSLLYKDLNESRKLLTDSFSRWNNDINKHLIDEGVQKILDRLIFIRVAEDREVEQKTLIPLVREWETSKTKQSLFQHMIPKFRELDKYYNSNLFSDHPVEKWEEHDNAIKEVIQKLYGKEGYYQYDFKIMPADVLGTVYENYLSYKLLSKDSKNKKLFGNEKEITIHKDEKKRKEQGIYYTPSYIVDFIVRNALKPVLDNCKSVNDLKKIKVLDPACGSGSFLLRALEVIADKYKEFGYKDNEITKQLILLENIYGVDLDEQAVDIARLNLFVASLDKRQKLPDLTRNIKNGNSLISGTDEEMKKQFGQNWREKKPFNWEEEFKEVFDQGGFDCIVGNPPYISYYSKQASSLDPSEFQFYLEHYDFLKNEKKPRLGSVMLFLEKSYKLLKNKGYLGFIVDLNIFEHTYVGIRKYLTEKISFKKIIQDLSSFEDVGSGQAMIIFEKINSNNNDVLFYKGVDDKNPTLGNQASWLKDKECKWTSKNKSEQILNKIEKDSGNLENFCEVITGVAVNATKEGKEQFILNSEQENTFPLLEGSKGVSGSYSFPIPTKYLLFDKKLEKKLNDDFEKKYLKEKGSHQRPFNIRKLDEYNQPKIFLRQSDIKFTATYSEDLIFGNYSLFALFSNKKEKDVLKFILGLLNSKLLTFYGVQKDIILIRNGKTPQIRSGQRGPRGLRQLPIKKTDFKQQKTIIILVDKMLSLNKELHETMENSNEWEKIKAEIEKTDKKIDQEVYKLYGLEEKEIEIIENSGK